MGEPWVSDANYASRDRYVHEITGYWTVVHYDTTTLLSLAWPVGGTHCLHACLPVTMPPLCARVPVACVLPACLSGCLTCLVRLHQERT